MHVLLFILFFNSAFAEDTTLVGFDAGIRLMQEQKFDAAADAFKQEYLSGKTSAALFYNWGHAAFKLQQIGLALGLWRKALSVDPGLSAARDAISFLNNASLAPVVAEESSLWQDLQNAILSRASLNKFLIMTWLFFVAACLLLIRYFGARKHALRSDLPLPKPPTIAFLFSSIFVLLLLLSLGKSLTLLDSYATVISPNVPLRTGPSSEDNILFDLAEGLDVEIQQVASDWVLITVASGASGWVPKDTLFQTSGRKPLW